MIPPTPTSLTTMPASKAKIGFSIDSIVGDDVSKTTTKDSRNDFKYVNDYQTEIARALRLSSDSLNADGHIKFRTELNGNSKDARHLFDYSTKRESSLSPSAPYATQTTLPSEESVMRKSRSPSPHRTTANVNNNTSNTNNNNNNNNNNLNSNSSNSTTNSNNEPVVPLPFVNGLHPNTPIRPLPMVPSNLVETKTLPSYLGLGAAAHANPHLLQIQMAAAIAQRQAAEQSFSQAAPFRHAPPPHLVNPAALGREGYPLYPWLISRHGRMFPHAFPGSKYQFSFFFPFLLNQ